MTSAQGAAVSTNGLQAIQTTTVLNSVTGDKELQITFTNGNSSGGASMSPIIKLGAWKPTTPANGGATSSSVGEFASYDALQAYLRQIQTLVVGARFMTNNPANFETGKLSLVEKQPDGTEKRVVRLLNSYMQALGGGTYANEVVLPADKARFLIWQGLEVAFEGLLAASSITIYLTVQGWNKAATLTPLDANTL